MRELRYPANSQFSSAPAFREKPLKIGLLKAAIKKSGLTDEEFAKML